MENEFNISDLVRAKEYNFDGVGVNVVIINGEVWFLAGDIAAILGKTDAMHMVRAVSIDEKTIHPINLHGKIVDAILVFESGVFKLIWDDPKSNSSFKNNFYDWIRRIAIDARSQVFMDKCNKNQEPKHTMTYTLTNEEIDKYARMPETDDTDVDSLPSMLWLYKHKLVEIDNDGIFTPTQDSIDNGILTIMNDRIAVTPKGINVLVNKARHESNQ